MRRCGQKHARSDYLLSIFSRAGSSLIMEVMWHVGPAAYLIPILYLLRDPPLGAPKRSPYCI
jgi:hypothetical protein